MPPHAQLVGSTPEVGTVAHAEIFGAPAHFNATFSKAGATTDGYELEWTGIIGCIASFVHGFVAKADGDSKTTFTHYEHFNGGVLGCLPASVGRGIVKKNYDDFNAKLKAACEGTSGAAA